MHDAPSILVEGHNFWRRGRASRVAFLVDGKAYFDALAAALARAERSIWILGWDLDSRIRLHPDRDERDLDLPDRLGDFLDALVRRRPGLHANVSSWDWAVIYANERELFAPIKFRWGADPRIHFRLDGRHPVGASHHQKVVVVDDTVAFVGGLDLTHHRWDTPDHRARDSRRDTPWGEACSPFHDVQMMVEGEVAAHLGDLARERWKRLTGQDLPPPATRGNPWPDEIEPDLEDVDVAISRTMPAYGDESEVREIERQTIDAIGAARRFLYVENQYFTAQSIGEALAHRLAEPNPPDLLLVSRLDCSGWLEDTTMGVLRARLFRSLASVDRDGRFRAYYPSIPGLGIDDGLKLHSKILIVDDELLRIGSSNWSNRSMGLDTECDLTIEARGEERIAAAITRFRRRLLAEHLGVSLEEVSRAEEREPRLGDAVETLRGEGRTLRPLECEVSEWQDRLVPDGALVDPEAPISADRLVDAEIVERARTGVHRPFLRGAIVVGVAATTMALWRWTSLSEWTDPSALVAFVGPLREHPLVPVALPVVYALGGIAAFPVTVLIMATVLLFGPSMGFVYALVGSLASAAIVYGIGRFLGQNAVRRYAPPRLGRLVTRLSRNTLLAVAAVRIFPVGPFTVVNLLAGAARLPFGAYVAGTLIGMTAGTFAIAFFGDQVLDAARDPGPWNFAALAIVGMAIAGGAIWLRRRANS